MVSALVTAVVGALVGAALNPITNNVMAYVFRLVEEEAELSKELKRDMVLIKKRLPLVANNLVCRLLVTSDPIDEERDTLAKYMRELLYDIEDIMDRILRYSECSDGDDGHKIFVEDVNILKQRLDDAIKLEKKLKSLSVSDKDNQPPVAAKKRGKTVGHQPVGIDDRRVNICEMLESHPTDLSVISIVGFSGLGKTTLAKAVYECYHGTDQFQCRAWVVASDHKDDASLLKALQMELFKEDPQQGNDYVKSFLEDKRYLVVLDDIKEEQWVHLRSIFPVRAKKSRIIVTTTNLEVANLCCNHGGNGYVYHMKPLGKGSSKELLEKILEGRAPVGFHQNSDEIVKNFDGHPLSLVSVANYLLKSKEFPDNFWNHLGARMRNEYAFSELRGVLVEYLSSLQGHDVNLKMLLLYMCVFPNTHPISRSILIRRWLAEGYFQGDLDENLKTLIDLSIIRSIDPSKNANPKTCRPHGIMHEFLLDIARSIDFITDLGNQNRNNCRHLFLDPSIGGASNARGTSSVKNEVPRAHSLTVRGSAGEAVRCFTECELLRVLDLQECNTLGDEHTADINKLWHLKYLSLGTKIKEVPKGTEKLRCLETLDMRKSMEVIELPMEVIKLPKLAQLLGKFKLRKRDWENTNAEKLLGSSNLQILTGFLTDDNPGFPMLMYHMKVLSKVKIWCDSVGKKDSMCFVTLLTAIKLFVARQLDTNLDSSLSLDLGNSSEDILTSLQEGISTEHSPENPLKTPVASLSSLKLHGELKGLTQITTLVTGLRELCLSSTNGLTREELSNLSGLLCLQYLKLVNVSFKDLKITRKDFNALRRLCLVQCEGLPQIEDGALPDLLSLLILNTDLGTVSSFEIKYLKNLQEVGLASEVDPKIKKDWEKAALKHSKRPRVLFFNMVNTRSKVKYFLQQEEEAQNPDSRGSDGGSSHGSGPRTDELEKIKESNQDNKNSEDEKAKGVVLQIKDAAVDVSTSAANSSMINNRKGKGDVDDAIHVKEGNELVSEKAGSSIEMVIDDRLKRQDDGHLMVKAN